MYHILALSHCVAWGTGTPRGRSTEELPNIDTVVFVFHKICRCMLYLDHAIIHVVVLSFSFWSQVLGECISHLRQGASDKNAAMVPFSPAVAAKAPPVTSDIYDIRMHQHVGHFVGRRVHDRWTSVTASSIFCRRILKYSYDMYAKFQGHILRTIESIAVVGVVSISVCLSIGHCGGHCGCELFWLFWLFVGGSGSRIRVRLVRYLIHDT